MIQFLFISGLALRLMGLINIRLGGDFAIYWKVASNIASGRYFPWLGPTASVNEALHFGPIYYYILTIPYLLGRGHYQAAIIFFSLLNSLNIFLIYFIAKALFNKKVGATVAVFYAFSAFSIAIDSFPWNYYILPFFILLAIYSLIKIQKGRLIYLPFMFFILGVAAQIHIVVSLLIPVFFLMLPFKKIHLKYWLISGLVLVIVLSPYLLQVGQVIEILKPKWETCSLLSWLQYHGHGERCFNQIRNALFVFRFFSYSLFHTQNLLMVGLCFLMTIFLIIKKTLPQKRLFIIWLGVPILFLLFYSAGVQLHYFLIFFPIPIFLFSLFLYELEKLGKGGIVLSKTLFISTILANLVIYLLSLSVLRI